MPTDVGALNLGPATTVRRMQVRGRVDDALAARQRLDRALAMADLAPKGLPASAIVAIRRLRDPLPGRWRLDGAGLGLPLAWQQAVSERIAALSKQAARPAHGPVPESADAVVFMDRSELLACLARDWHGGLLHARWWWRSVLGDARDDQAVVAAWLASAEYAPAAMQQLAATRDAVEFVRRLDVNAAQTLCARIVHLFGLEPHTVPSAGEHAETLRTWVPEAEAPALHPEQVDLLRVSLALARAPQVAREVLSGSRGGLSVATQSEVASPNMRVRTEAGHPDRPGSTMRSSADPLLARSPGALATSSPLPAAQSHQGMGRVTEPGDMSSRVPQTRPAVLATPSERGGAPVPESPAAGMRPAEASVRAEPPLPQSARDRPPDFLTEPEPPRLTGGESEHAASLRALDSGFAGILFLINIGLHLELYGDFSQPARPGIALPVWDFVAMLGEALAGPSLRGDPLWTLLADLAGRPVIEEPGRRFASPAHWRVPTAWLVPFSSDRRWTWSQRGGRLRVFHPAGFAVIDVPVWAGTVSEALTQELTPYYNEGLCAAHVRRAPPACVHTAAGSRGRAPRRWFGWLWPYVKARLAAGLGVDAGVAGRLLCALPARIEVTATHLDAHFPLAELPLEVRLSGLDRDPSWVPAAGRYIAFHFD